MTIRFPDDVRCVTRTASFSGTSLDFGRVAQPGLPDVVAAQLETDRFLVSTSVVTSDFAPGVTVDYQELLLKVPVSVAGRDFLFPVAAWVTHEYSLVRGYLLGFNKFFRPAGMDGPHELDVDAVRVSFRDTSAAPAPTPLPSVPEQGRPFLLWTDYDTGTVASRGLRTLDTTDYVSVSGRVLEPRDLDAVVFGETLSPDAYFELTEQFTMTGTTPVEGTGQ